MIFALHRYLTAACSIGRWTRHSFFVVVFPKYWTFSIVAERVRCWLNKWLIEHCVIVGLTRTQFYWTNNNRTKFQNASGTHSPTSELNHSVRFDRIPIGNLCKTNTIIPVQLTLRPNIEQKSKREREINNNEKSAMIKNVFWCFSGHHIQMDYSIELSITRTTGTTVALNNIEHFNCVMKFNQYRLWVLWQHHA